MDPEFVKLIDVLTKWQVALAAIGIPALVLFRGPIGRFIDRLHEAQGPGFSLKAPIGPQALPTSPVGDPVGNKIGDSAPAQRSLSQDELAQLFQLTTQSANFKDDPASRAQAMDIIQRDPAVALELTLKVVRAYSFERAYANSLGTQLRLLLAAHARPDQRLTFDEVQALYDEHVKLVQQALKGASPVDQPRYVSFLHSYGFIEGAPPDGLRITRLGSEFISYMAANYGADWPTSRAG